MSQPLVILLISVTANLVGMIAIFSFLAFFLARLQWHGRGVLAVLLTIIAAELFWIGPTMIGFDYSIVDTSASYSLCFGNWLVSAFSIILFCQAGRRIPRQLEDTARIDGCSSMGIYWHVVLPLIGRELSFIALLLAMATALPFWANLTGPGGTDLRLLLESVHVAAHGSVIAMLVVSAIMTLPIIAIFFFAKRDLQHALLAGGTGPGPFGR